MANYPGNKLDHVGYGIRVVRGLWIRSMILTMNVTQDKIAYTIGN